MARSGSPGTVAIDQVAFDPVTLRLATTCATCDSVALWSLPDLHAERLVPPPLPPGASPEHYRPLDLTFDATGQRLATGTYQGVRLWDTATLRLLAWHDLHVVYSNYAFSPDGAHVLANSVFGSGLLIDAKRGSARTRRVVENPFALAGIIDIAWSPDSRWAVATSFGGLLRWDAASGRHVLMSSAPPFQIALGGGWAAGLHDDGKVELWKLDDPKEHRVLIDGAKETQDSIITNAQRSITLSHDARLLATLHPDGRLRVWSLPAGSVRFLDPGTEQRPTEIGFSPDGRLLAYVYRDADASTHVLLWDSTRLGDAPRRLACDQSDAPRLVWSPSGKHLAVVGTAVELWDSATASRVQRLEAAGSSYRGPSVEFSRDGRFLAIAGGDLHLFRIADGARLSVRAISVAGTGEGELRALALGGDGRLSGLREDAAANIESASGAKPSNSELEAAIDSGLLRRFFADMAPRPSPPP